MASCLFCLPQPLRRAADLKREKKKKVKKGFDPMTETPKEPVYASKAKPWLKYYE